MHALAPHYSLLLCVPEHYPFEKSKFYTVSQTLKNCPFLVLAEEVYNPCNLSKRTHYHLFNCLLLIHFKLSLYTVLTNLKERLDMCFVDCEGDMCFVDCEGDMCFVDCEGEDLFRTTRAQFYLQKRTRKNEHEKMALVQELKYVKMQIT